MFKEPNFDEIIFISNVSSKTPAHPSIHVMRLYVLAKTIGRMDDRPDSRRHQRFHCAYLKGEWESLRIPLRGKALFSIKSKLGRLPRGLLPGGSYSLDWLGGEIRTGEGSPLIEHAISCEIALGEQFTALEAAGTRKMTLATEDQIPGPQQR